MWLRSEKVRQKQRRTKIVRKELTHKDVERIQSKREGILKLKGT